MVEIMSKIKPDLELPGANYWFTDGKYHRLMGPCIVWSNGDEWWYFKGKRVIKEEHPFTIFCKEYNLSEIFDEWPDSMKILFKLSFGGK